MLAILDGWGWREDAADNAVRQARTPNYDRLWASCPHSLLRTSGKDVGLPDGRGDGLAAQLLETRAGMPIIIATGYGEAHLDASLRANPRIAILSKPYDMAQLQAAIEAVHPAG